METVSIQPPNETGSPHDKQWVQDCCELITNKLPENYAFMFFAVPTPAAGTDRCFYASNARREDIIPLLEKWIAEKKANFGTHHL